MKYNKDLFLHNIKCLISYGYEPELTINLKNNESISIVAYEDFVDLVIKEDEIIKLEKIENIFDYIIFEEIVSIEGDIDFEFPIESQSIVYEGKLWIDGTSPNQIISKFKRELSLFKTIFLIAIMIVFIYFIITILHDNTFNLSDIIACLVFGGAVFVSMSFLIIYDIRRNRIIKKYYGPVSEDDKKRAKELLDKIHVIENNEYDFYVLLRCDLDDLGIARVLKLLIKGKKVYIGIYEPIKLIEQELLNNKEKYNDIEFNSYIFELGNLLENNLCVI